MALASHKRSQTVISKSVGNKPELEDNKDSKEFPGGPAVRTLYFYCRGHGFWPWSGDPEARPKEKKKKDSSPDKQDGLLEILDKWLVKACRT